MSPTLGEKLREAREARGISISEVAEQTRISPLYIKSIENDDYKPLPGGIFNKGFLKSYARYIGFDEHEALQEYSKLVSVPEQTAEEEFKSYRPEVLTDDRNTASILPTAIFAGVILALMTGGILVAVNYIKNQPESTPAEANLNGSSNTAAMLPNEALDPAVNLNIPLMESLRVEFKTASAPISISAIIDGRSSVMLVTPDRPAAFEPKQALRLAYSKSLSSAAQLTINGRNISLPQGPANPKRAAIELEVNRGNISQIWQVGAVEPYSSPSGAAPTRPAVRPTVARPAAGPTSGITQRPAIPRPTP